MAISDGSSDGCSSELLGPVLDDAEVARMLEETVDVVDDDEVQVEKQRRPFETAEAGREGAELAPGPVLYRFRQRDVGHRQAFDSGLDPGRVIGEADEAERQRQVARHHRMQDVDELGTIGGAPLHADAEIGRASGRARVCQYGSYSGGAVSLK